MATRIREKEPDIQRLGVGLFCSQVTLFLGPKGNPETLLMAAGEVVFLCFNFSLFKANSAGLVYAPGDTHID